MSYEITGRVKVINETHTFDSGFCKREFVITTDDKYPQDIKLELIKDKCEKLDAVKVGENVTVKFNINGNEYNEKYYVNLQALRITAENSGTNNDEQKESQEPKKTNQPQQQDIDGIPSTDAELLPF